MSTDRDFIRAAIELGADRVLYDPTDDAIVFAVEEILDRELPRRWADRLTRAIIVAHDRAREIAEGRDGIPNEDALAIERSVVSTYGLC